MQVFHTANEKIEKPSYDIEIKNIDLSSGHWGSEKEIVSWLDEIENFLYNKDTLNKQIILHTLKLLKNNIRIKNIEFYRIPEENKLILLTMTEVKKMKNPEIFTREMSIVFKKEKFAVSIIEIIKADFDLIKKGDKTIPINWILDEKLTSKIKLLKEYQ
jgi:hypothetical protein